jgi:glycerol-3-phosphate dehydrogenase
VSPKDGETSAAELAAMLVEVNAAFPFMKIGRSDIRFLHQGLTPAVVRGRRAELMPVSQVLRAGWPKREGLFAVIGVKFTTARQTAEIAVDSVCEWLGTRASQPVTAATTLPHAGLLNAVDRAHPAERELARDIDAVHRVIDWYGTEAAAVFTMATSLGMTHRLANDVPVLAGEVAYAVRAGHAWRLSDIVFRRTPLGSAGHPGRAALEHAAAIMGNLLKWTPERREHELREVEERFRLPE